MQKSLNSFDWILVKILIYVFRCFDLGQFVNISVDCCSVHEPQLEVLGFFKICFYFHQKSHENINRTTTTYNFENQHHNAACNPIKKHSMHKTSGPPALSPLYSVYTTHFMCSLGLGPKH